MNQKRKVFQMVNNSRIIWYSKAKPKGILGGHLNIRSLRPKSEQINHLLSESNLDFICLSETWLHKNSPSAADKILGYVEFRRDRAEVKGGGVLVYVRETIQCREIEWQGLNDLECIGLNMILAPQISFTLIVIYRPPSSNISFLDKFKEILCQCDFKKEVIIMGDLNLNWEDKTSRKKLKQISDCFNLVQMVKGPTPNCITQIF